MNQNDGSGLNTKLWPVLLDHYNMACLKVKGWSLTRSEHTASIPKKACKYAPKSARKSRELVCQWKCLQASSNAGLWISYPTS